VAITGSIFSNILGNIQSNGSVVITAENDNIRLTSKTSNALIKCVPYEDFPTLPTVTGTEFMINSEKLIEGFKVYIYTQENEMIFVATDSFRLAEKRIKLKQPVDMSPILIPLKNISDIVRTFESNEDDMKVTLSDHQVSFTSGGVYVTSRLINGTYPDYRQIVPKEYITSAVVLKSDLIQALRLSNVFSGKFNQITFTIDPEQKTLSLASKNNDVGEQKTVVSGSMKGEKIEVLVNYRYLSEVLGVIGNDSISIECSEATRPIVVKGVGDTNFLYLMMPMNR
jgi:DNA polymerase-3 subunit beta